jgi:hypothetical protein
MRMLQAQDDPSSAALLTRAHAVVPVVNSIVLAVDRESRDAGPDARFMSIDLWDCQRAVAVAALLQTLSEEIIGDLTALKDRFRSLGSRQDLAMSERQNWIALLIKWEKYDRAARDTPVYLFYHPYAREVSTAIGRRGATG